MAALAKLIMTVDEMQDREAWLKMRNSGVGGSEVAAVLGRSNWGSPFSVWQRKVDPDSCEANGDTERMKWGRRLEDSIADGFAEDYGLKLRKCGLMQRKDKPWMLCSVDRLVIGKDEGVEIKTSASYMKDEWPEDGLPEQYYFQVQWYMACTGFEKWWVVCLLGGNELIVREVERNEEDIKIMEEAVEDFWLNYVVPKKIPAVDGSDYCRKALIAQYPGKYGDKGDNVIELDSSFSLLIEDLEKMKESAKILKTAIAKKENELRLQMGDTCFAHAGTYNISYKPSTKTIVDSEKLKEKHPLIYEECKKTTNSRTLRITVSKDPKRYEA